MPDQITSLLDQIDRLDQEATKGPWEEIETDALDVQIAHVKNLDWLTVTERIVNADDATKHDIEFIALARTALPQLAKALRAVTKECARLRKVANNTAQRTHNVSRSTAITQAADSVLEVLQETLGGDHVA